MTPRVNPEPTYRIYDALASFAGACRPVTVDDPWVSADVLVHADGRRFAFLVSQAGVELTVKPLVAGDGVGGAGEVTLGPYGVRVLELRP